jgi:hypothetical protein
MPFDAMPLALPVYEEAYVASMFRRLLPGAVVEYNNYILERTRAQWQVQMGSLLIASPADAAMPAYEKGYVSEFYNGLVPGATAAFNQYILSRTPAPWQDSMAAYLVGFNAATDADVVLWVNQMIADGTVVTPLRQQILSWFTRAEKDAGVWALTDDYWMLWGENVTQARRSFKQLRLVTEVNSPVFANNRGYVFLSAETKYVNSNFIPATHAVQLKNTGGRIEAYVLGSVGSNGYTFAGRSGLTNNTYLRTRSASSLALVGLTCNVQTSLIPMENNSPQRLIGGQRTGNAVSFYRNGAVLGSLVATTLDSTLSTQPLYIGCENALGVAQTFITQETGYLAIGAQLSAAQLLAHYTNVQTMASMIGIA